VTNRILAAFAKTMLTEIFATNANLMLTIWKKAMLWVVLNVSVSVQLIAAQVLHFELFRFWK